MYIFNDNKYVLRLEYFGGLIINKISMEKFEISKYDAIFLLGIKKHLKYNDILSIIYKIYNVNFEPDIDQYIMLEILKKDINTIENLPLNNNDDKDVYDDFYKIIKEVENINHLRSPIELTIYPTFKCQLNCEFCFLGKARLNHSKEYDSKNWIQLVNSFVDEGVLSVSILGGEPALYYDIIPLLIGLDKLGIRVSLTTNAQNWSEELFETVVNTTNLTVIVSLESFEKDFNNTMGKNYDVEKAINLILRLRKYNKRCRVNSVYTTQNDQEILEIVDFCSNVGVEKYSVALCFSTDDKMPTIKQTNELGERVRRYIKEKNYTNLHFAIEGCMIYSSYSNINGKLVNTEFQKKQYGCECGNTILEVVPDGSLYSCAAFISQSQPIGNAFKEKWQNIWFTSETLGYLRNTQCTDSACTKCELYHFCNGGCPAYKAQQGLQNMFQEHDARCIIAKQYKGD